MPSSSQLAINSNLAKRLANGSVNSKEHESTYLLKLVQENSLCDLCRKCFSEKKKLNAHRKLCLKKMKNKMNLLSSSTSSNEQEYFDLMDQSQYDCNQEESQTKSAISIDLDFLNK